MGAHLIFFIIFTLFSCIILTNQSLPWYSLRSRFQCDTKMAAVFSCMRPLSLQLQFMLLIGEGATLMAIVYGWVVQVRVWGCYNDYGWEG